MVGSQKRDNASIVFDLSKRFEKLKISVLWKNEDAVVEHRLCQHL